MVQQRIYKYFERTPQLYVQFISEKMNINVNEMEFINMETNNA